MYYFLDAATLFALFDTPGEAVRATIEAGGWSGIWPGHDQWHDHSPGGQLFPLALHYFTTRHPDADHLRIGVAAQALCQYATEWFGGYPVEEPPLWAQVDAWVLSLAGEVPPAPGRVISCTPPCDAEGRPLLPGGDPAAFTRAIVLIIDELLFGNVATAQGMAVRFLQRAGDDRALRAGEIFRQVALGQRFDLDAVVGCATCGTQNLDVWYTGQTWGETLCETCYTARVTARQARPLPPGEA